MNNMLKYQSFVVLVLLMLPTTCLWAHNPGLAGNRILGTGLTFIIWVITEVILWRKSTKANSPDAKYILRTIFFSLLIIPIICIAVLQDTLFGWVFNI